MKPERFLSLIRELVDENPFAIRPFLKVAEVSFTDSVPTLAVTREASPRLLVNLAFLKAHCRGDAQVKAVILHEFLHILLRHTEGHGPLSPAEHLAMDAVINAIIHRQMGPEASSMMSRYYAEVEGLMRLLRPPAEGEKIQEQAMHGSFGATWEALYAGRLVVDDIRELAETMGHRPRHLTLVPGQLLGNHEDDTRLPLPAALQEALEQSMRAMNGGGIWRTPRGKDTLLPAYEALMAGVPDAQRQWQRTALKVLLAHLLPDRLSRARQATTRESLLPILSPADRRAFLQSLWSPVLPTSRWDLTQERPRGAAQIYLDVSGSMNAEMPLVIGLLNRLRSHIRTPFWAFSTVVAPARITKGILKADTTGGTSLACVLDHLARTQPEAAVIVTDGYIESIPKALVRAAGATRIHILLTRDGSGTELSRAGLSYTQLPKVPS